MTSKLIYFALVNVQLLMFKICGIIAISKIGFFNFSSTEMFKESQSLASKWITFHAIPTKIDHFFCGILLKLYQNFET